MTNNIIDKLTQSNFGMSFKKKFLMNNFTSPSGRLAFAFIFVFFSLIAGAQSKMIKSVFKLLPPSLVYGINGATKDSMLKRKTYYPAENDSVSVLAFNYGASTFVEDYMYISMSYETSQRAFGMVEWRSFDMEGEKLIVVSSCGGVEGINYQQKDISAFLYGNNKLSAYKAKIFPDWSEKLFLKLGVPDSIKKVVLNNSNLTFNFSDTDVVLSLNSSFLLNNEDYRKWLKGDQMKYTWTGKQFIAGLVYFSDQNL